MKLNIVGFDILAMKTLKKEKEYIAGDGVCVIAE